MQLPHTARVLLIQPVCLLRTVHVTLLEHGHLFVSFTLFFVADVTCLHFIHLEHFHINSGPTRHARVSQHMAVAVVSSWSLYKLREITASD